MRTLVLLATTLALGACSLPLNRALINSPDTVSDDQGHPELALLELRLAEHFNRFGAAPPTTCVRFAAGPAAYPTAYVRLDAAVERRLLLRFPGLAPKRRCAEGPTEGGTTWFVDRDTGAPAAMFDVHELVCTTTTRCKAWAGYLLDRHRHGWRYYEVRFTGGKWRVREAPLGIVLT